MKIDNVQNNDFDPSDSRSELFSNMGCTSWMARERGERRFTMSEPCPKCGGTVGVITESVGCRNGRKRCLNCKREEPKINFDATAARKAKYRAAKRNAIPPGGYNIYELREMRAIYRECRLRSKRDGIEYHVDHIIPLSKGGLHHPSNLQILIWIDNIRKGNKTK